MSRFQRFSDRRKSVIDLPVRLLLIVVIGAANVGGAIVVATFAIWVLPPGPLADPARVRLLNAVLMLVYLSVTVPLGVLWGTLRFRVSAEDPHRERQLVLYAPLRLTIAQGIFWALAAVLFGIVNTGFSVRLGLAVTETVVVGGISTCALCYLLAERILRRTATKVLRGAPPRVRRGATVLVRFVLFWALGTAVPVSGMLAAAAGALIYPDVTARDLAVITIVIGVAAVGAGLLTTVGAARAVADPVRSVRRAMQEVEEGRLDAAVPVYDATELGRLQAGFNTMVDGLRERDRIRDLFARQVGHEVASVSAAAGEIQLGGEVRNVAVLFVDLVGSTSLAARGTPTTVVELLNRFFAVVVEVVESCGGWINKFEGDAALAVFGAPNPVTDPAGQALCAGRTLAGRLAEELPDLLAGIGISAGDAVAGYVGDLRRFEYTVIGDPVNEAARLTELAKATPERVLAAGDAVALARPSEAARWVVGDGVTLRGRTEPTRLAEPAARSGNGRGDHPGSTARDPQGATRP
jgi:adenylate cyclase